MGVNRNSLAADRSAWQQNCIHWFELLGDALGGATGGAWPGRTKATDGRPSDDGEDGSGGEDTPQAQAPASAPTRFTPCGRLITLALRAARASEDAIRDDTRETVIVLDRIGREVLRRQGSRNVVPIYKSERELLRGATFTHNHPEDSSFSLADIVDIAAWGNVAEMRAAGSAYRYSMRPGPTGWPAANVIRHAYRQAVPSARSRATRAYRDGKIGIDQVRVEALHEVWTQVAQELDLVYHREA